MGRFALLGCLLSITIVAGALFTLNGYATGGAAAAPEPIEPSRTEEDWIVGQTILAVGQLARLGGGHSVDLSDISTDPSDSARFLVRVGTTPATVLVNTYVWDPGVYEPLARTLGVSASETPSQPADEVISALVNLTAEMLRSQNRQISVALAREPRNPTLHEAAALLLTALALREASGIFSDTRLVLSRASAHLTVAHVLRGPVAVPSLAGQLAETGLQLLAGRPAAAVRRLDVLTRAPLSAAAQSWSRALRQRATLDWRQQADDKLSLIEQLEYVRSISRMVSTNRAVVYVKGRAAEAGPDSGWRILESGVSVETAHALVKPTLAQTYTEMLLVLAAANRPAVESLDRTGDDVRVIDDSMWAAFYQRHLAHLALRGSNFYRYQYMSEEAANEFDAATDSLLRALPVWPIVRFLRTTTAEEYKAASPGVLRIVKEDPETVPYLLRHDIATHLPAGAQRADWPSPDTWFKDLLPRGTAFQPERLDRIGRIGTKTREYVETWRQLSPWDAHVADFWARVRCENGCTSDESRQTHALIEEYHLPTMRKRALASADPVQGLRRLCDASADECWVLSDWLLTRDRFAEAAGAHEAYVRGGLDRVGVANSVEWLTRYYQRSGRADDALRIAEEAASTGSRRGLSALAGVHDRMGNHARALEVYREVYQHYDQGQDLLASYLRHAEATGQTPLDVEYSTLLNRYFGGALRNQDTKPSATAPSRGLLVTGTSEWVARAGVRVGDIVIALDGINVTTLDQSRVLYDRSFNAPLRYTVWRDTAYVTIEAAFRDHYSAPLLTVFDSSLQNQP